MKKSIFKLFTLFILVSLFVLPTRSAYAQGPTPGNGGRVIFGDNFTLEKGKTFNGDLVVFGGNVTVEDNANLNGNLVVIGGTIKSGGEMKGDVVVVGGQVELEKTAHVTGDVVTVGSQLARAEGATIEGEVVNNAAPKITLPSGQIPPPETPLQFKPNFSPFLAVAKVLFRAVAVALLAMLVVMFLQPQIERVGQAIVRQPVMSGGVGLLAVPGALIATLIVSVVLALTLILIPVALVVVFLGGLLLTLAWLFGIIALGQEVGERFTRSINQTWAHVLTAGFGTFLLMLVGGAIGEIPCVGWVVPVGLAVVGIGAVVITRFGTQLPPPTLSVSSPPAGSSSGSGDVPEQLPPAA